MHYVISVQSKQIHNWHKVLLALILRLVACILYPRVKHKKTTDAKIDLNKGMLLLRVHLPSIHSAACS